MSLSVLSEDPPTPRELVLGALRRCQSARKGAAVSFEIVCRQLERDKRPLPVDVVKSELSNLVAESLVAVTNRLYWKRKR